MSSVGRCFQVLLRISFEFLRAGARAKVISLPAMFVSVFGRGRIDSHAANRVLR